MRHTRAHTRNRRSHHALSLPRLSKCGNCTDPHLRHRACDGCGQYRGKSVVHIAARIERAAERKQEKAKANQRI